ncbi:hypothetical protein MMC14_001623 [Varicellaria rhodocarpa]|nr:hypothetical protein [Varicellaria rhodocarpa]
MAQVSTDPSTKDAYFLSIVSSIDRAYSTANPTLYNAAADAFHTAAPSDGTEEFQYDLYFDHSAPAIESALAQLPTSYRNYITSELGDEAKVVTSVFGTMSIPSFGAQPTAVGSGTGATLQTLSSVASVSGSGSLTTITTAPKSTGSSTGVSSSSGSSVRSASSGVSSATAATGSSSVSQAAAAPMNTGVAGSFAIAAVGMIGLAML